MNTDVTGLDAAMQFLQHFQPLGATPTANEPADMALLMSEIIQAHCSATAKGE